MERDDIFQDDPSNRSPLALDQEVLLNGQFRVGRVLGVGGFGITYLAFDEVLEMVVAVKEYLPNNIAVRKTGSDSVQPLSSSGEEKDFEFGLKRFLQEARTLAKFEAHPNIVRVRTFFEENGTGYLVMNFYEGRTLAEYLASRNGFLPEEEALLIMDQVVDGLSAVHGENILHRDIDPNNVYLADNGTVVLLDFGAARTAVGERTKSMSVVLKRGYAPHEQYHSHGDQGAWTDVYACSATLYRTVTGYKPPEAAARILEDDLAPPSELVPSLSDATNEAIVQGLEIRPDDRPQSMEENREMSGALYADREEFRTRLMGSLEEAASVGGDGGIVMMGYCFGGAAVLEAARAGAEADGFVSFHGGLGTPEGQGWAQASGPVLLLHGSADPVSGPADLATLVNELQEAGIEHDAQIYGGARHSFTVYDSDDYDLEADRQSWEALGAFLQEQL